MRFGIVVRWLVLSSTPAGLSSQAPPKALPDSQTVVFVCEHGTVKSVVALAYFRQLAQERHLSIRAISRGTAPDSSVPSLVRDGLRRDGLALGPFTPSRFTLDDLASAIAVISFDQPAVASMVDGRVPTAQWDGLSAVSENYADARDSIRHRVARLVDSLDRARRSPPSPAQDKVVPVEAQPHHKTVLKNEYLQIFRVTLEPGETSLMHRHSHDDAAVRLHDATVVANGPGEAPGAPEVVSPGLASARDNEKKPHTHRVHNIGTTLFDVIDVQILKRPNGPAAPPVAVPATENPQMRVYRYDLEPGAGTAQHTHTRPYLLVAATDMNLRTASPDGGAIVHLVKAGHFDWFPAPAPHTLINEGRAKGILVEFELK